MPERYCQRPGCGRPIPSRKRRDARWCSRSCESKAARTARRKAEFEAANPDLASNYREAGRGGSGANGQPDWRDDPRNFSDYGDVDDDQELAARIDAEREAHDARVRAILGQDEEQQLQRQASRGSWRALRQRYSRNPGVELPDISQEKTDRYQAGQARIKRNLRNSTGQPQDRFNDITRDVVATKGTESRQRNKAFATMDPRPASQRHTFDFQAESADGGPYRGGRASGTRPRRADYAWNMQDGW